MQVPKITYSSVQATKRDQKRVKRSKTTRKRVFPALAVKKSGGFSAHNAFDQSLQSTISAHCQTKFEMLARLNKSVVIAKPAHVLTA